MALTLTRKCLLLLKRSWWWTFFRSFLLPVAFIIFMGESKNFFIPYAVYGVSDPTPVLELQSQVGGDLLAYYANDGNITDEMRQVTLKAFNGIPQSQIHELSDKNDILKICRENFRGASACYGAVEWNSIEDGVYNYTLRGNSGLSYINIKSHKSATDVYVLPLQWAMDKAITGLDTAPNTMAFTRKDQDYHDKQKNRQFTNIIADWIAPALFLGMIGVIYHLTGVVAQERELGISNLLSAMGVGTYSRLLSFHLAFSVVYLLGWVVIGVALALEVYGKSNAAIFVFYHIISGLSMVSYSLFLGSLFKSAQLAGIISSVVSVILAIVVTLQTKLGGDGGGQTNAAAVYVLSFLFPPTNYSYFLSVSARWQHEELAQNMVKNAPETNTKTIVIFVAAIVHVFAYFGLSILMEHWIHGVAKTPMAVDDDDNAVKISHLRKSYNKKNIPAVDDLSFNVHKGQIVCLLGANGSGKTTTLEMVSGIQPSTSGEIVLGKGSKLGICPQKNVLWDKLTVQEHVEIWAGIKGGDSGVQDWIEQCDLGGKEKTWSKHLSGGQKRKLQLAITFVGGSNVCCIDEVSSGLDPVSRRKIWDILLAQKISIILTTHFLDEADLLADHVVIMSKGTLKAEGTTVQLKHTCGYRIVADDNTVIEVDRDQVLEEITNLDNQKKDYQIIGPELEDVFLKVAIADHEGEGTGSLSTIEKRQEIGTIRQIITMFLKRMIIFKRAPLAEIAAFAIPIVVAAATRSFLVNFNGSSCSPATQFQNQKYSPGFADFTLVTNPLNATTRQLLGSALGLNSTSNATFDVVDTFDQFKNYINANHSTLEPGGVFENPPTAAYRIDSKAFGVYEGTAMMNLLTNLRSGDTRIVTKFSPFQNPWGTGTGDTLQFVTYFGLAMSVAPAFVGLYPTFERLSRVRAMHYSNGLRIFPLWTAYTLFNFVLAIATSAILTGVIGSSSSHIIGIGYMFLCFMLYHLASILLSYIFSLFVQSQLAAFAIAAAVQAIYFLLYLIAYLCVLAYGHPSTIPTNLLVVHFTMSTIIPVANLIRTLFVALNLFGVLCKPERISYLGDIEAYGGPILYFIVQCAVYFAFILWWDSGKFRFLLKKNKSAVPDSDSEKEQPKQEVADEMLNVEQHPNDYTLRLDHVSKSFGKNVVVDDVTYGVRPSEVFALLGPNGAGKTTTFNMLRGEEPITKGEVYIDGISVAGNRTVARSRLGVCPQFDAMDKMTVTEILKFYSRLRGLSDIDVHVDEIIHAVGLDRFKGRMAHKLSGGNKRKLSLAIALIGDPPVLLLDEPSSGMDAFAKRIMWKTLARVAQNRSIVLTTHSMEEADALAHRAGILSKRLLTVGTTSHLRELYGSSYHIHLICDSAPHTTKSEMDRVVQWLHDNLQATVGDRLYQGQIKVIVPASFSKSVIFKTLETNKTQLCIQSFSVSSTTLEEVFLRIVN